VEFAYNFGALGIPVFLVLMLFEYLALKKRSLHVYSDSVTSGSMGAGLLVSEALFKVYTLGVYIWLWDSFRIFDFETTSVMTWIVFFFGVDFCYYWFHRIAHERNILWGAHEGHHQGEEFNYTTAIRQSAFQYGFSWIFYLPLAILGCPPEVFLGQFVILKGYQFWIHTQGIDRVPFIEGIFSTPSSHRVHHAKNPTYIDRNYGGTMVIWDRMFGTWQPELRTEACHYGTTNAPVSPTQ
jgi:sterol desaturase/sphingolipid hydroxylase (fatty acid hydroxylase superfamily)